MPLSDDLGRYNGGSNYGGSTSSGSVRDGGWAGAGSRALEGSRSSGGLAASNREGGWAGASAARPSTGGGNVGGALNAGLGRSYAPNVPGGLRGVTGPYGEPRTQPTAYGTNYQTAQMLRAAYPSTMGRYDQTRMTNALGLIGGALPGEAHVNRFGTGAMNDLARVSLNQMAVGVAPEIMAARLDTTGLRPGARGFEMPGPNSMGMTTNWPDQVKAAAYDTLAANALQEALRNQGVSPQARNASNFVAAGTAMPRGVRPVGTPVNGTQFGTDTTWGNRVARANAAAQAGPVLAALSPQMGPGALSAPQATAANTTVIARNPQGPVPTFSQITPASATPPARPVSRTPLSAYPVASAGFTPPSRPISYTPVYDINPKTTGKMVDTVLGFIPGIGTVNSIARLFGYSAGTWAESEARKVANMSPQARAAYFAKRDAALAAAQARHDAADSQSQRAASAGTISARERPDASASSPASARVVRPSDSWMQDALAYGYSTTQLDDPATAAIVKQIWDMGFIPKTQPA